MYLTPYAMAKYIAMRDFGGTEVGGFAVTPRDNLLLVEDLILPKQIVSAATVEFDGVDIAELYDVQSDKGLHPVQYSRIWWHTHPGDSPTPSGTDEETFREDYGNQDHAIMLILAQGGKFSCRLKRNGTNGLPGMTLELPVEVAWDADCPAIDAAARNQWRREYEACVFEEVHSHNWLPSAPGIHQRAHIPDAQEPWWGNWGSPKRTSVPTDATFTSTLNTMRKGEMEVFVDNMGDAWRLAELADGHTLFWYPADGGDGEAREYDCIDRIRDRWTLLASQYDEVVAQHNSQQRDIEVWYDDGKMGFCT